MLKHYSFIPFQTASVPSGSSLVFAPHPDDETFGIGGTILQMTDNHQKVNIVMMTDGEEGGNVEKRKRELNMATEILGAAVCHYFAAPDGNLEVTTQNILRVTKLIEEYRPENIFFPSPMEYHPDHRATAWLVWNALQSVVFTGNIFSYEIANQSPVNELIDITPVMSRKKEVMQVYTSQQAQRDYFSTIVSSNTLRAYTLPEKVQYAEAFFHFPDTTLDLMTYYYKTLQTYHGNTHTEILPLVSVLIRTKDRPELLKNALESVSRQRYKKIEVNIVNDGGVDVQSVVDKFDFDYCYVKTHKTSKGRAAAANALLKMIQGEYAIFLDDDDTFDPDHIENLVNLVMKNEGLLAAYSGIRVGNDLNRPPFNKPYNAALLRRMNFIPFHAVLFSSKLLNLGCQFDESLLVYEDWDFWLQVAQHTEFHHFNKITATYNINGQSGAGGAGGQSTKELDLHQWTLKVYEKWQQVWSAKQIAQTFHALASLNTQEVQKVKSQMKTLQDESQKKLQAKDKSIEDLKKKLEQQRVNNGHTNRQIDYIIAGMIKENDAGDPSKRDFELVSARNYEAECIALFEEVFKEPMSQAFWNWKYAGTKWRGICVLKEGKVVGHYNGMPRSILYFGKHKKALASGDTMISPKARGGFKKNSPFYTMVWMWGRTNFGPNKEFLLSYGFPNRGVMSLAEKIGLYKEVDTITEIHWSAHTIENNDLNTKKYTVNKQTEHTILELWRAMASDFTESVLCVRNVAYLKNRYVNHPKFNYDIYLVHDSNEKLQALFVLKKEGKNMQLMDIVAKKEHFSLAINEALKITKENDGALLKCWITTSKVDLFDCHDAKLNKTEVSIPTSNDTPGFKPESIKNKWFLMYGDTDFI